MNWFLMSQIFFSYNTLVSSVCILCCRMYWSETKDGKICRRNPPSNSLGNNRRQDQIFDSQLLFMGHLLIGILTFGTKRGSEKVFRLPKSFLSIEGEKSIAVCICALSRLESFGVKIDCQKDELKKYWSYYLWS